MSPKYSHITGQRCAQAPGVSLSATLKDSPPVLSGCSDAQMLNFATMSWELSLDLVVHVSHDPGKGQFWPLPSTATKRLRYTASVCARQYVLLVGTKPGYSCGKSLLFSPAYFLKSAHTITSGRTSHQVHLRPWDSDLKRSRRW